MALWAITSYYNPIKYKSRLSNYKKFRNHLEVPLVAVELSFDGAFELAKGDADILIQLSGGSILFQKERLLNIALRSVPQFVDKLAWIDCDVLFERRDWVDLAEKELEKNGLIQLFSEGIHLNQNYQFASEPDHSNYEIRRPGIAQACLDREAAILANANDGTFKGLAWAAQRQILDKILFYDAAIAGGGDLLFIAAAFGAPEFAVQRYKINSLFKEHYLDWAGKLGSSMKGNVGHIEGQIWHLWHGAMANRNRGAHGRLLEDFNPYADIVLAENGAWTFTAAGKRFEEPIRAFFVAKKEDG